jgi:hypothetical protein
VKQIDLDRDRHGRFQSEIDSPAALVALDELFREAARCPKCGPLQYNDVVDAAVFDLALEDSDAQFCSWCREDLS